MSCFVEWSGFWIFAVRNARYDIARLNRFASDDYVVRFFENLLFCFVAVQAVLT